MSEKVNMGKGKISFAMIFAGLLFFVNPCVNLVDIFPDMFGALLIYLGLRKQAVVDGYFEDARKISFYLVFIYLLKFAFSISVLSNPKNSLPYTFISSVIEIIFLFVFFHKLFAGFEYTFMRISGDRKDVGINESYFISMVFVGIKCVVTCAVELFELATQGGDLDLSANAAFYASIAGAKKYAILLSIFIQLVLGILFAVKMAKFFSAVKKHPTFCNELAEKYNKEFSDNRTKHLNKTLSAAYILAVLSVVFIADLSLEGFDLLPDVLTSVFVIISFIVLSSVGEYVKVPKLALAFLGVAGVVSTVFFAYVNPESFYLLAKENSMFKWHSAGFYNSINSVYITALVSGLFATAVIYAVVCFIDCNRKIYKNELMGNHDRKLLTVGVMISASAVLKAVSATVGTLMTYVAAKPVVSDFISERPVMTAQKMAECIAENADISLFANLENISFFVSFFAVVFVVFAFFNTLALKAEAVKEE